MLVSRLIISFVTLVFMLKSSLKFVKLKGFTNNSGDLLQGSKLQHTYQKTLQFFKNYLCILSSNCNWTTAFKYTMGSGGDGPTDDI